MIIRLAQDAKALDSTDWTDWCGRISKVFKHKMPESLIESLAKLEIPEIEPFLKSQIEAAKRKSKQDEAVKERYDRWLRRRDSGNQLANQERLNRIISEREMAREKTRCENDIHVQQLSLHWGKKIDSLVDERDNLIKYLHNTTCMYFNDVAVNE